MVNLITNELKKISYKTKTKIFIVILILLVLGGGYLKSLEEKNMGVNNNWQMYLNEENQKYQEEMKLLDPISDAEYLEFLNIRIIENNKMLVADTNPFQKHPWQFMKEIEFLALLCLFISLVLSTEILPDEYQAKTIKLLILQPYTRMEILISKFISIGICNFLFLVILFSSSLIIGSILFSYNVATALKLSSLIQIYVINILKITTITSISFMCSVLFKNNILAVFSTFGLLILPNFVNFNIFTLQLNLTDVLLMLLIIIVSVAISIIKFQYEEF